MAEISYSDTELLLLDKISYLEEISIYELEELIEDYENEDISELWVAIELGRCPSTDERTYILHTYYSKPEFDYYGAEKSNNIIYIKFDFSRFY